MEITRNVKFNEEERNALTIAINLCNKISEAMGDSPKNIFDYLSTEVTNPYGKIPDVVDFGEFD